MSVTSTSTSTFSTTLVEGALAAAFALVKATSVVAEAVTYMPSSLSTARANRELALVQFKCTLSDDDVVAVLGDEFVAALRVAAFSGCFDAVEAVAAEVRG